MKSIKSAVALLGAMAMLAGIQACGGCSSSEAEGDCLDRECSCASDAECPDDLACVDGECTACADELGNCLPAEPTCITPCSGNLTEADGTVRVCDEEGLLEGCLPGSVCERGACVPKTLLTRGLTKFSIGECEEPTDCPDYQTCVGERCVSTCEEDEHCADGAVCHRRVCRAICTEEDSTCPGADEVCHLGRCVPTVAASSAVVDATSGSYTFEPSDLVFDSEATSSTFTLTNTTESARVFHVSKASESRFGENGIEKIEAAEGDLPLPWLELGVGEASRVGEIAVTVPADESVEITVAGAKTEDATTWKGTLEIRSEGLQTQRLRLSYAGDVTGAWVGRMYTFGTFEDGAYGSARPLDEWMQNRTDLALLDRVPNAFLSAWGRFRNNAYSIEEFRAILRGTLDETWKQPRVGELCEEAGYSPSAVCVPFGGSGSQSVLLYSSDGDIRRVPTGVVALDFAMNVRDARPDEVDEPTCNGNPSCLIGRIDSSRTLQYAGNPEIALSFEGSPQECAPGEAFGCRADLSHLSTTISMGGRYIPDDDDPSCDLRSDIENRRYPWLVSGFSPRGVTAGTNGGPRMRRECVDTLIPAADSEANADLSRANPVPDGLPRVRGLEMVDGFVVNQGSAFILVRETVEPFVPGGEPLASYALLVLRRQDTEVSAEEFRGAGVEDTRDSSAGALDLQCDAGLISQVTGVSGVRTVADLTPGELTAVARAVVRGDTSATGDPAPRRAHEVGESVHYVCVWEETIAGGTEGAIDENRVVQRQVFNAGMQGTTPCPPQARVVYVALDDGDFGAQFDPATLPCNQSYPETCLVAQDSNIETLSTWVAQGRGVRLQSRDQNLFTNPGSVDFDLVKRCDNGQASCDGNALDLTEGKTFLEGNLPRVFFDPIEQEIYSAFRYKTEFVSRTGASVGFAPEICEGGAELTPYCYDPEAVSAIQTRVDCALAIMDYHAVHDVFDPSVDGDNATLETLRGYLDKNFSQLQSFGGDGDPIVEHGYERMLAELLIMQGDDSYTASFASRFDLAGTNALAFEGSQFEEDGVNLSGVAGFEMYSLYRATQYYEMVLDRFYSLMPALWRNVNEASDAERFVTQKTVTSWLTRVARASTQNAAAWSEIARRYQALNRPDLARRALSRAYARAFTESTILSDFLLDVTKVVSPSEVDQVILSLDDTRRRYRVAMTDMQQAHNGLTDNVNYFGLPPDLVPFPALSEDDVNGFEVLIERARESFDRAAEYEEAALAQTREFDTDAEAFRSELVGLRLEYEEQLGEICGTFVGEDGRVYPAIGRYAHLHPDLALLDDPCGAVGHGQLHSAAAGLQTRFLELQKVRQRLTDLRQSLTGAANRAAAECKLAQEDRDAFLREQRAIDDVQGTIDSVDLAISQVDKAFVIYSKIWDFMGTVEEKSKEGLKGLAEAMVALVTMGVWVGGATVHFITTAVLEDQIRRKEAKIRERQRTYEAWTIGRRCDYLAVELGPKLRAIQRDMDLGELDALDALWNIDAQLASVKQLNHERVRAEASWEETNQLIINEAAAHSDPNVRIFKNDAIIGADRTFQRALRDTYRATRMYEYYTSTSYANFEQLFLVRLVHAGEYNLSRYLDELEEAFFEFEDQLGNPDTRVAQVSLRDDILKIPRYSDDGHQRVLTARERADLFREAITDERMLDESGHLSFEFATTFDELSPLTANHKILFTEVEIVGDDLGDNIGRIYLRQLGTGVVRDVEGESDYYTFPPMAAVMNPVFNGDRSFGQDSDGAIAGPVRSIFRSYRFRDRPFVQTRWELVLNQRDELVNEDINLGGVDDIVLTIFYTDFTP